MATEKDIKKKWNEVIDYATQHAKNQGMHKGFAWLRDSFNEYLTMSDEVSGYSMGGQRDSRFNREVLSGRIIEELDGVGSGHVLDEQQLSQLKESLKDIVETPTLGRGLKI